MVSGGILVRQLGKLIGTFDTVGGTTGIDSALARHISHLFIRDPLVVFSEMVDQDDETSNDHFEVRVIILSG